MEHDEVDNDQYSKDLKEYILVKLAKKGPNEVQLLQDLVRQIKQEERMKKDAGEPPSDAIKLSKRKLKKEIEEEHRKSTLPSSKQKTLTDFKLKPIVKQEEEPTRPSGLQFRSKKQLEVFEATLNALRRPKRSVRSKRSSDDTNLFPPVLPPQTNENSTVFTFFHDSYYYTFGTKRPDKAKVDFVRPLELYEDVAYDMNSEEEYEEIKCDVEGEQITAEDNNSDESSMSSLSEENASFCVSDGHLSADQLSSSEEKKVNVNTGFAGVQWKYWSRDNEGSPPKNSMMHCTMGELPLFLGKEDEFNHRNGNRIGEIHQACHKNSRSHIISTLKNDFGIQKEEAVDYINTFCNRRVFDKRTVYVVKSIKEQNLLQGNDEESITELNQSRRDSKQRIPASSPQQPHSGSRQKHKKSKE